MGVLPQVFMGDQAKADDFIEEVKGYLWLNQDVAGFDSPMKKIVFMLMLIKGPDTARWTQDMGTFLDGLDPGDNIPELWTQFLAEFRQQFQDTQKEDQAQVQLEGLQMRFPEIDTYIESSKNWQGKLVIPWGTLRRFICLSKDWHSRLWRTCLNLCMSQRIKKSNRRQSIAPGQGCSWRT
jgi:hypothetical protein